MEPLASRLHITRKELANTSAEILERLGELTFPNQPNEHGQQLLEALPELSARIVDGLKFERMVAWADLLPETFGPETPIPDEPESTWSVDREENLIVLDNGYQVRLDERRSEWVIEKRNESGEVESATRIWGDPHIDIGHDGKTDVDFKKQMTFVLGDETKITVVTREKEFNGTAAFGGRTFSDELIITKGDQLITVSGLMQGADEMVINDPSLDGIAVDQSTNDGFVVLEDSEHGWVDLSGEAISDRKGDKELVAWDEEIQFEYENDPEPSSAEPVTDPPTVDLDPQSQEIFELISDEIQELTSEIDPAEVDQLTVHNLQRFLEKWSQDFMGEADQFSTAMDQIMGQYLQVIERAIGGSPDDAGPIGTSLQGIADLAVPEAFKGDADFNTALENIRARLHASGGQPSEQTDIANEIGFNDLTIESTFSVPITNDQTLGATKPLVEPFQREEAPLAQVTTLAEDDAENVALTLQRSAASTEQMTLRETVTEPAPLESPTKLSQTRVDPLSRDPSLIEPSPIPVTRNRRGRGPEPTQNQAIQQAGLEPAQPGNSGPVRTFTELAAGLGVSEREIMDTFIRSILQTTKVSFDFESEE